MNSPKSEMFCTLPRFTNSLLLFLCVLVASYALINLIRTCQALEIFKLCLKKSTLEEQRLDQVGMYLSYLSFMVVAAVPAFFTFLLSDSAFKIGLKHVENLLWVVSLFLRDEPVGNFKHIFSSLGRCFCTRVRLVLRPILLVSPSILFGLGFFIFVNVERRFPFHFGVWG